MRFTPDFIEKVREANNLVEIISPYTELKGNGHRLMGRCPFPDHSDKSPSFSVSEDNQLYFCYGCKKGGNVYNFLETFNGMSFPEAVEYLARRASIPIPENESAQKSSGPSRDAKDLLLKINRVAAVFYHQQLKGLPVDHVAHKYIEKRGLDADTVEKFRLGVSLDEWQGLYKQFRSKGVPMEAAEELGLMKPKKVQKRDDSHFDQFRDRLIFPIFNSTSDVIGFGGRTFGDAMPKYLNSSDSPVFNKSRVLYGIHETGKFIRAQDSAIVVEGYMDAIALYAAGIKNVVAILGTAFTPDHAKILKRYTLNVTMLLDGDEAGLNGAERSLPILLQAGLMPKGFALPEKMDPDDFVKANGADRLRTEVDRAPELFTLLLTKRWMTNYHGTSSEKVRIVEEAAGPLARITRPQLAELYMMEIARQLDVEVGWVRRAVKHATTEGAQAGARRSDNPVEEVAAPEVVEEMAKQERVILKGSPKDEVFVMSLILNFKSLMMDLLDAGPEEVLPLFSSPGVQRVLHYALSKFQARPEGFSELAPQIASLVDNPASVALALMVTPEPGKEEGFERKLMDDYMGAIRNRHLKQQAKTLAGEFKTGASPEKLEAFMALQRNRFAKKRDS